MNTNQIVTVQSSNEGRAMTTFMHRCYDGTIRPEIFAQFVAGQHPSLQQAFFRCMMEVVRTMAGEDYPEDARNHAACELSRRIVASGAADGCYLAYL